GSAPPRSRAGVRNRPAQWSGVHASGVLAENTRIRVIDSRCRATKSAAGSRKTCDANAATRATREAVEAADDRARCAIQSETRALGRRSRCASRGARNRVEEYPVDQTPQGRQASEALIARIRANDGRRL